MVALITQGLRNQQIAERAFLAMNTVKSNPLGLPQDRRHDAYPTAFWGVETA